MTLSNVEGGRVWQRAFQAVADLDKHLAVLNEHKKNHAIAALLLSDTPRLCHALCVISDIRIALHFRKNRDHHLVGSVSFELSKLFVKTRCNFFRNNTGIIIEVRGRLRRNHFRCEALRCKDHAKSNDKAAQPSVERTRLACRIGAGLSTAADAVAAAREAAEAASDGCGGSVDLCFAFLSGAHADTVEEACGAIGEVLAPS